ncbi:serine--tRNA ligase [Candidatus Roizmanbacteria bacterium RIFCSPLOWO2_01_FULL_38_12]|uniref:Serine--tRNA ligase n=1 Tax=Candidatus Roizmanbacteria bacterium RIFCSPLOWO2_01_FULL_38_12 TaxID=1802061 RepID=A0A1F7IRA6_9BACT|nr:MAG: serine--tRNA ligase [Candidatus Roizmanbacteria bacterium RIFCSPHIGHO2_01_FULL_38_15]OGK35406.1 MAG: serine--tRNA ligase [Candidatus Roizmanbacteria bacterium RIFCSPHIGHO2_12_FULL_38_13]OGK45882.1 MAG: serine--tRNA ligase [Candidatus Roizmanbacteria bacterium RIFCSPLOWO2_01_FULL_38_12]
MLDINYIRKNPDKVKEAAKNKNREVDIDKILELDTKRIEHIQKSQKLREERNAFSKGKPDEKTISRGKEIKSDLQKIEGELRKIEEGLNNLLLYVPNVPLDEVPVGKDATGNKELKKWGELPKFNFKIKDHITLGMELDIFDLERGSKVSGFRGYFLKNEGAILQVALLFYVLQKLTNKGYTPFIAPSIIKQFTLVGSGHFPWGSEQDVYKLNDDDMYLAGTAEIPITAYHAGEILQENDLPKRFVGFSPCFRKEAGAYGKDTKGLYRLHEFWKIEQVILAKNDLDEARKIHEELENNAEEILQELKLPHRQLLMCTGDMGEPQLKKYDIETWMPSRNAYGETMSNSIMGDFQARRLNIRYKTKEGKAEFVYTFNNTAVASPRILIAILENYQQEDGSVKIPNVLQKYTGFEEIKHK